MVMADQHRPPVPIVIEQVVDGLKELETVLGAPARAVVPEVQALLTRAMAARDRGDPVEALRLIGRAMAQLSALADRLDPREAALMRMVTERFQAALLRGDLPEAKQDMDVMLDRSGSRERKKE
jgi:hypothetical protein